MNGITERAVKIVGAIIGSGLTLFCFGLFWQAVNVQGLRLSSTAALPLLAIGAWFVLLTLWRTRNRWWPSIGQALERHTGAVDADASWSSGLQIAVAAGLCLYVELMVIRFHSSLQLFAYFKNVSLFSCFLGLGIGYARGNVRPLATPLVLPLLALQLAAIHLLHYQEALWFLPNPVSEQIAFGVRNAGAVIPYLTVYGFIVMIFALNAVCFVPLGHLASRVMLRKDNLTSYSWNLVGSLIGILLFTLVSFAEAPPGVWVLFPALALLMFLRKDARSLIPSAAATVLLIAFLGVTLRANQIEMYSPYQLLALNISRDSPPRLHVNNMYFQNILDLREQQPGHNAPPGEWVDYYALPYRFKPAPNNVLVVGAGTGNDVASALRHDAGHVDAVEIDPAILRLGKSLHPEAPYQSEKVTAILNDARAHIRNTDKRYDLIVYGLLDSHTLLSGLSGIRLDSYVYTVDAFREARARLNDGGIICMTFSFPGEESEMFGRKIFLMLQNAFGGKTPIVYQPKYDGSHSFIIGEQVTPLAPQMTSLKEVTVRLAESTAKPDESTDDWPFLYMPARKYPLSYVAMILVLLAVSGTLIRNLMPSTGNMFSVSAFFLGAGFMLLEAKAITELALVYGSTWTTISVVIAWILVMAFMANWLVSKAGSPHPAMTYGLLLLTLVAGLTLTSAHLRGFAPWLAHLIMAFTLTVPMFFSGLAFSDEIRGRASVQVALSSNLMGAILGGFLEYNSMAFGFRALYFLAMAMYALALFGSLRRRLA